MNFMLAILPVLLLFGYAEGYALRRGHRKFVVNKDSVSKNELDGVKTWFTAEVARLDVKDAELRRTDRDIMKKNRETDENLGKEIERLNERDNTLNEKDQVLMSKDDELDKKDDVLMSNDRMQQKDINRLRQEVDHLKKKDGEKDEKLKEAHEKIAELQNREKKKVAFDAHSTNKQTFENAAVTTLEVTTNLGGLFDEENGSFMAGCTGTYRFTIDAFTKPRHRRRRKRGGDNGSPVRVCLRISGDLQDDTDLFPEEDEYASCTVVRRLHKGEMADVFSKTWSNGNIRFTGHLIKCDHPEDIH